MSEIVVAGASQLAADVGGVIADQGGNAVDAAIGANLTAMITEPGVCAIGGGGFVTVWPAQSDPVTFDGYMEMPGRGLEPDQFGRGSFEVTMEYGGGVTSGMVQLQRPARWQPSASRPSVLELFPGENSSVR